MFWLLIFPYDVPVAVVVAAVGAVLLAHRRHRRSVVEREATRRRLYSMAAQDELVSLVPRPDRRHTTRRSADR